MITRKRRCPPQENELSQSIRLNIEEALGPLKRRNFVVWKPLAAGWLEDNFEGWTQLDVAKLMYKHIQAGEEIDQVVETRSLWKDGNDFHYDFRPVVDGRKIYLETLIDQRSPGPTVLIVTMKYA